jgi:hypothetical protein
MGKRSCTLNPAVIELEHEEGVALYSSKRRALQVASNTAAMSLLAMGTKLQTAVSEEAFPLNKPAFPLNPQLKVRALKFHLSSITDDEDENERHKERPGVFHHGPRVLTQSTVRNPIPSIEGTRQREASNHPRKIPFGRPLPPAPLLPSLLLSRGFICSTQKP